MQETPVHGKKRPVWLEELQNAVLIVLGVFAAAMGLHGFLLSSNFIDGGVTGISMLLSKSTGWPLSLLIPVANLPFIVLGYRRIGRAFAIRSTLAIAGLSVVLATVHFPDVTPDSLLTAVFGGLFIGLGIGLAVRGGAVLDGTEIAALLISKRSDVVRVGDVILVMNVAIFLAAMSVLGVESALYSILTYAAAAKTLEFVIQGIEQYTAITVVSGESPAIRARITGELGRGVTVYRGYGGHQGEEREILYCVVTRLEVGKVMSIVRELDGSAFVVSHPLTLVSGGMLKRSAHH